MHHSAVYQLKLVAAPFSNQEGEWFWADGEMKEMLSRSRLYMIGQREEVFFRNFRFLAGVAIIFDLQCGRRWLRNIQIGLDQFAARVPDGRLLGIAYGEKILRFLHAKPGSKRKTLFHWFTPDRLFYFYAHGWVKVRHLEDFRRFTRFQLHYVGISEKRDSFTRLFAKAHEKRSRILGNESQLRNSARLTDELTLFLFDAESIEIQAFGTEKDCDDPRSFSAAATREEIIRDAERAFIKILKSEYNKVRYSKYPQDDEGLAKRKIDRILFTIVEPISFTTAKTAIQGGLLLEQDPNLTGDAIVVEKGKVRLLVTRKRSAQELKRTRSSRTPTTTK